MGNCLKREFSSTVWAGDDWCSMDLEHQNEDSSDSCSDSFNMQREKLICDMKKMLTSSASSGSLCSHSATKELKIRISKRQLEQILDRAERLGLTAEQVIKRLMRAKQRRRRKPRHSWSSHLQSIPEIY